MISLALLTNCKESELEERNYPFLIMSGVEVKEEGAIFSAEVLTFGAQSINSYGFVWGSTTTGTEENPFRLTTFESLNSDNFQSEINSNLEANSTYYVRPFVETETGLIYGSASTFRTKGKAEIQNPIINSVSSTMAKVGDEVIIQGINFGYAQSDISVRIGGIEASITKSSDDAIYITIPSVFEGSLDVGVAVNENSTVYQDQIDINAPWKATGQIVEGIPFRTGKSYDLNEELFLIYDQSFVKFDPVNLSVESISLPDDVTGRRIAQSFEENGKLYVLFRDIGDMNFYFYDYDPASGVWSRKADFPGPIPNFDTFAFSIDGKGYFGDGSRLSTPDHHRKMWSYDIENDSWSELQNLDSVFSQDTYVSFFNSTIHDGQVYLYVSYSSFQNQIADELWIYDHNSDEWIKQPDVPINSNFHFNIGGKLYVGTNYTWENGEVFSYDYSTNTWEESYRWPGSDSFGTVAVKDDIAYIFGFYGIYIFDLTGFE